MRPLLAVALVLAAACSGAETAAPVDVATAPAVPATSTGEMTVDGDVRTYRTFVPPTDAGETVPLVLLLHAASGTGESAAQASQMDRAAAESGFAVVYPDSLRGLWNAGFCCGPLEQREDVDDDAFLLALLDRLQADLPIDPDRFYVSGVSNGAVMAYRLACAHPERFAGAASVAGTMLPEGCTPSQPLPVLEIHGTADPLVPYDGGEMPDDIGTEPTVPVPAVMARWADLNGCDAEPDTTAEGLVTRDVWGGCDDAATVALITIEGGGHTWYATEFGEVNGAVDATEEIAEFFGLR